MKIYVSTIIEKDNKFLMIQEKKQKWEGKWNFPSGHLEDNEYLVDGAKREVKEETNIDVEINGIVNIYNNMYDGEFSLLFVFAGVIKEEKFLKFDDSEIMDCKWFTYEEIAGMKENLRDSDYILNSLKKYVEDDIKSLDMLIFR